MSIIPQQIAIQALTKLALNPQMIGQFLNKLNMPNIEIETMGGPVFWTNLEEVNGWRLQHNLVFGNCRILDPKNVRYAWGGEKAMLELFNAMLCD
ncbi:MAG: hypothetical protein HQK76_15660 [Desulfobacterales bacterium]|nr:hypothetical protein [Desulfobacterales bacterium]